MTSEDKFTGEVDWTVEVRADAYGHPLENFSATARIKDAVAHCPDPILRVALDMIAVKMARLAHDPNNRDSWLDIAGYAKTAIMILEKQGRVDDDDR